MVFFLSILESPLVVPVCIVQAAIVARLFELCWKSVSGLCMYSQHGVYSRCDRRVLVGWLPGLLNGERLARASAILQLYRLSL